MMQRRGSPLPCSSKYRSTSPTVTVGMLPSGIGAFPGQVSTAVCTDACGSMRRWRAAVVVSTQRHRRESHPFRLILTPQRSVLRWHRACSAISYRREGATMFPAVIDPITTTLATNPLGMIAPGLRAAFDPAALMPLTFGAVLWVVLLVVRSRRDAEQAAAPNGPTAAGNLPKAAGRSGPEPPRDGGSGRRG